MDTREIDMQPARRGWLATHLTAAEAASDRHDLVQAHTERVRARQMGATILAIRVLGEDDGSQAYRKRYLNSYHKWLRYLSGLTAEGLISCLTGLASSSSAPAPSGPDIEPPAFPGGTRCSVQTAAIAVDYPTEGSGQLTGAYVRTGEGDGG